MFQVYLYRPRSEASEGYVFTVVCHSFCSMGGRKSATPKVSGQHLPPPGKVTTPPSPLGHRSQQHQRSLDNTSPSPRHRSQHLPQPLGTGDNTSPPPGPGHNTSLPPRHRPQHLPPGTTRRRAVRILLGCILVSRKIY